MRGGIVAVDPGGTTGIAWGPLSLASRWTPGNIRWEEVKCEGNEWWKDGEVKVVLDILMRIKQCDAKVVVIEGFALVPGRVLTGDALVPVRIEAMLRFALSQKWYGGLYIEQGASSKSVITDKRLSAAKIELPPKTRAPHARDAVRHLVLFLRRLKKGEVKLP